MDLLTGAQIAFPKGSIIMDYGKFEFFLERRVRDVILMISSYEGYSAS